MRAVEHEPSVRSAEAVSRETATRTEYSLYDAAGRPIHLSRIEHKDKLLVRVFPYNYGEQRGLSLPKIREIEFRGWSRYGEIPKLLKPGKRVSLGQPRIKPVMRHLYGRFPNLKKLVFTKEGGSTRFTDTTATFRYLDFEALTKTIGREISAFQIRQNTAAVNALAEVSSQFQPRVTRLAKGGLAHFLSFHQGEVTLSEADVDALLALVSQVPMGNVTITENFIETRNQINVAFLDDVIDRFQALMAVKGDNEKDWQKFVEANGWILASVFPYQVILFEREAYVGGKTIRNAEGRVVDFLVTHGFRDNYALLELKTHNTPLLRNAAYREPAAYALHDACSGAVSQCLDQKITFLTEFGQKLGLLDPKVVLIIGRRKSLSERQRAAFELFRANLKSVDVFTFDEVLDKLLGLRSILRSD